MKRYLCNVVLIAKPKFDWVKSAYFFTNTPSCCFSSKFLRKLHLKFFINFTAAS